MFADISAMPIAMNRRTLISGALASPLLTGFFPYSEGCETMKEAREIVWRRIRDDLSLEHGRLERNAGLARLMGTVMAAQESAPLRVDYLIDCDPEWRTRSASLTQIFRGRQESLRLDHDGAGGWRLNGAPAPSLTGCTDIDLGISPSTNALPVNRLRLPVGKAQTIRAAWVRFPDLSVVPAEQAYERLGAMKYKYRSLASGFEALIDVDEDGLPVEYQGIWRRIASGPAAPAAPPVMALNAGFAGALLAPGPAPELSDAARDFGWLAGGWRGSVTDFDDGGRRREGRGEWWFAWVLEGRAMQDVWIVPPRTERTGRPQGNTAVNRYGSTIRRFDHEAGLWRITWINPVSGAENRLSGRPDGDRILLEGEQDGQPIRWAFHDIRNDSFRWLGETRDAAGAWRVQAEFRLRRI